ncbi:MAG: EamA family transporter [Clostridia bacterium]|nr:EamA family transporter [Clostridia bacterium]
MDNKKIKQGCIFAFLSAFIFSFGGVIIKLIPWQGLSINAARNGIALIITLVFMAVSGHKLRVNLITILGGMAVAFTCTAFCAANKLTTAANAILLQYTSPVFVILLTWLVFRKAPQKRDLIMCAAVFVGIGFFFFESLSGGGVKGNLLALASAVTYAIMFVFSGFKNGDSMSSFAIGQMLSTAVGLPFLVRETDFSIGPLAGALALGCILGGGYVFLALALRRVSAVKVNLIGTIEPVCNPMWVALIYGEHMTAFAITGFIIVIAAVLIYNIIAMRLNAAVKPCDTSAF